MKKGIERLVAIFVMAAGLLGGSTWLPSERLHAAPSQVQNTAVVNLNKASAEEMQAVRGIGPKLAERIIKFREEKGKFQKIEDLLQVNGIGEAKLEKIKNQVTV